MKKNKILAFLLSLSIVTYLLSNLITQSSYVFASAYAYIESLFEQNRTNRVIRTISTAMCGFIFGILLGVQIGLHSTKEIPSNNTKIKGDGDNNNKI